MNSRLGTGSRLLQARSMSTEVTNVQDIHVHGMRWLCHISPLRFVIHFNTENVFKSAQVHSGSFYTVSVIPLKCYPHMMTWYNISKATHTINPFPRTKKNRKAKANWSVKRKDDVKKVKAAVLWEIIDVGGRLWPLPEWSASRVEATSTRPYAMPYRPDSSIHAGKTPINTGEGLVPHAKHPFSTLGVIIMTI